MNKKVKIEEQLIEISLSLRGMEVTKYEAHSFFFYYSLIFSWYEISVSLRGMEV